MTSSPPLRLRSLPVAFRLGVTGALAVLLLGFWAAVMHIEDHYRNRDMQPELTIDDLRGSYAGIQRPAPLVTALERGHPEDLADEDRTLLLEWLDSGRVTEDYDNIDLGDFAPEEIIDVSCNHCHSRQATEGDGIGQEIPLEFLDDVQAVAFAVDIPATPTEIMRVSTHTHALALGALTLVVAFLLLCTRWPGWIRHGLVCVTGLALLGDLGGMWLTRANDAFVWLVVGAGAAYSGGTVLAILIVFADLWLPRREA